MQIEELKQSLKQLHANLEGTGQVDEETERLLHVLEADIRQLLDRDERDAQEVEWLSQRAQELSARFAVRHPAMEGLLVNLSNMLASMGI